MKFAILADIHANLHALNAVLDDSKAQNCTHYACLGDLVGYGAYPNECVKIVREMGMPCVKGSFDEYCATGSAPSGHDEKTANDIRATHAKLNREDCRWLHELPSTTQIDGFKLMHGTLDPSWPSGWVYNARDARGSLENQKTPICFFGKIHIPIGFVYEQTMAGRSIVKGGTFSKIRIEPEKKYLVNPGSVGQPRDNNPKAAYAIYTFDNQTVELRRVDYDWKAAQDSISI